MSKGLAIVGNGKMGKLVDSLAHAFDFEVRARFATHNNAHATGLTREALQHVDVAIEFSTPQSAPENLLRLASLGVPTVTGTTGWYDQLPAVTRRRPEREHFSRLGSKFFHWHEHLYAGRGASSRSFRKSV